MANMGNAAGSGAGTIWTLLPIKANCTPSLSSGMVCCGGALLLCNRFCGSVPVWVAFLAFSSGDPQGLAFWRNRQAR
jgi:hypothetical protein